ncbi:MAG: helix-turn-helix domain-containing protein, partial [Isosphaeraceae bacterium]
MLGSRSSLLVRNEMPTIWLLHCGVTRQKVAEIVGLSRATVQRYVDAYCKKTGLGDCSLSI